jgi:hypothetical protein
MTGLIVFLVCFTAHLWLSLVFARREYRRRYAKLSADRVPAVYGRGWMTPSDKRDKALQSAYLMMAFWPAILSSRIFRWVITSAGKADPYVIETIERELYEDQKSKMPDLDFWLDCGGTAAQYHKMFGYPEIGTTDQPEKCPCGFIAPCPCGYLAKFGIHCGGGTECHAVKTPWVDPGPSIIFTPTPEFVRYIRNTEES